jgi:predicted SAM-dependent methyltransferase
MTVKSVMRRAVRAYRTALASGARARSARTLARSVAESSAPLRVHLGCGPVYLAGWLNVDIERDSRADVRLDLRNGLPLPAGSASHVFSEHVFEHLDLADGRRLLRDVRMALGPGGLVRIAMPDLSTLVERYENGWRDQEWLKDPGYAEIDTAAHMLNFALRSWDHRYVYDFDDLELRLHEAGFSKVRRAEWGASEHEALQGLERRPDSLLIVEATR